MKRTPCEYIMWVGLPVIRKEIAASMVSHYGLSQREAACKLGVSPAAISQYLSKKRGKIKVNDQDLLQEIRISAKRIIDTNESLVVVECCRICKFMIKNGFFEHEIMPCCEKQQG